MHVVKFNPTTAEAAVMVPPPKPAKDYVSDWYKNMGAFHTKKPIIDPEGMANRTVKLCTPFGDAMNAGYIQETWQDIQINIDEDNLDDFNYIFPVQPSIISHRDDTNLPVGEEFYPIEFVFHPPWTPELPKGWSMLYISPLNKPELPFWVTSGVVDNDKFTHSLNESNLPFYLKKSFKGGVIPKGTPMYQMIPIKRESWASKFSEYDPAAQLRIGLEPLKSFWGGYKKTFWQKKEYR